MCSQRRVLVVDDHPSIRTMIVAALTDEGYVVRQAEHGGAALRQVATCRPCLILLDLRMPVMDGRAFAAAYHRTPPPHAPILILSAEREAEGAVAEIGAVGLLRKPFDLDELLDLAERHVAAHWPSPPR